MRQLIMFIASVLFVNSASAFQDLQTKSMAATVESRMLRTTNTQERLLLLSQYKDFLFQRLNSIELPAFEDLRYGDPLLEEYRSLTEYEGYISLIDLKDVTAKECYRNKVRMQNSAGKTTILPVEARDALKILEALCS